jgi:hypothetical protein
MSTKRFAPVVLAVALLGAGALALFHTDGASPAAAATATAAAGPAGADLAEGIGPEGTAGMNLPPNHPPIGGGAPAASPHGAGGLAGMGGMPSAAAEPPALAWTAPKGWQSAPNPNGLRLATYRSSASNDVAIVVSRAGGTVEANVARWTDEFTNRTVEKRTVQKIHGLDVTVVEVGGTFAASGMMSPGGTTTSHDDWRLVGAIVPTPSGSAYFFKLLGPSPAVRSARGAFDALVGSLAPATAAATPH